MNHYVCDAWNRLVQLQHTGQTNHDRATVALRTYDGTGAPSQNRRAEFV